MSKIIGVDAADIDGLSGIGTGTAEAHVLTQPSTGLIVYGGLSLTAFPFDWETFFSDIPTFAYELSSTSFARVKQNNAHILALDSSGNLYHKTSYNQSSQLWGNTTYNVLQQVLTGVTGFWLDGASTGSLALAIKTDGTLWGVGYNYYGNLGLGNQTTQNSWVQIGSDTDWKDIRLSRYNTYALKGGTTDTYLYATGRNTYGATGQGTTAGNTTSFTRVKTGSATDWSENLNYSINSFKFGACQYGCMVINSSGELFMFGRANTQFPANESASVSNNSSQTYVVQLGTDTDWQQVILGDYDSVFRKNNGLYTVGNTYGFNGAASSYYTATQYGSDTDWDTFDDTIQHGYGRAQSSARVFKKNGVISIWGSPSGGGWNNPTTSIEGANITTLNSFPTGSTINSVSVSTIGSSSTTLIISVTA